LKYEKSNQIHLQTMNSLIKFTHKLDTLTTLYQLLLICVKFVKGAYNKGEGVYIFVISNLPQRKMLTIHFNILSKKKNHFNTLFIKFILLLNSNVLIFIFIFIFI